MFFKKHWILIVSVFAIVLSVANSQYKIQLIHDSLPKDDLYMVRDVAVYMYDAQKVKSKFDDYRTSDMGPAAQTKLRIAIHVLNGRRADFSNVFYDDYHKNVHDKDELMIINVMFDAVVWEILEILEGRISIDSATAIDKLLDRAISRIKLMYDSHAEAAVESMAIEDALTEQFNLELYAVFAVLLALLGIQVWFQRRQQKLDELLDTAKESIELHSDRFKKLADFVPIGIFRADVDGAVNYVNKYWLDIANLKYDQELGYDLLDGVHSDDKEYVVKQYKAYIECTGKHATEYRYVDSSGVVRYCLVKIVPELDQQGVIIGHIGAISDMTAQHHHTVELTEAKVAAEHGNRTKLEFLATMSHELRTPLNAVIGFSDMIKHKMAGPITDKYVTYADNVNASGQHLLNLIDDILEISKIESGKMELNLEEINARELMDFIDPIYQQRCADKNFAFEIMPKFKSSLTFEGDNVKIKQVLTNLLNNAIKFTNDGGVCMECWCDDKGIQFTVVDTGMGIPKDLIDTMFEPFTRSEEVRELAIEGSGLGLSIVKKILDLHGFSIAVKSDHAIGTQIHVTIPPEKIINY